MADMSDQQQAMSKFRKSNESLRQDLPVIAETFDSLLELLAVTRPTLPNPEREWIIKSGVIAGSVVLLFPPFQWGARGSTFGLGHSFVLLPPKVDPTSLHSQYGAIDGVGLIAILVGIALITWAATLVRWRR